jgi:mevalonate pyrophosphate decarboxylase
VCASDLAVVTGHNPYKDKAEIYYKYWKKHFKDNYAETLEILKNKNLKNLKEETHMQCLERISQENNINVGAIKNKVFA